MTYSDVENKDGIMQMIEQTTGLGDATVTDDAILFAYFNNLINQWYRIAAYFAWKVDKSWSFDDENQADFPQPTTTLVDDQRDYTLPTTALRLRQAEILDSNGKYYTIDYMPENATILRHEKEQETAGKPSHYRLSGESIILYPKPDTSQLTAAKGLRISIDREVSQFAVTDTTKVPGIVKEFHPILYYGPCLEWATIKGEVGVEKICTRMLGAFPGLNETLQSFYADRNQTVRATIAPINYSYK